MADVMKSVFRQRELEKVYEINDYGYYKYKYSGMYDCYMNMTTNNNVISDKEIGVYDIEIPLLEVGDTFFLHDIQEVITIKSRMRSSDGSITYYAEDKLVETENTKLSKEKCLKTISNFEKFKEKFEDYKKKYKYEHRFFNF